MLQEGKNILPENNKIIPGNNRLNARSTNNVAGHLEEAAVHYRNAAKYREEGNHEKAHKSSIFALGHCCLARELLREDVKDHAWENFQGK
jgi:hypothetical protein